MKFSRGVAVAAAAALCSALAVALPAAAAVAQDPEEPPKPELNWPNGDKTSPIFFYVDTITASSGAVKADRVCMQTNFFRRGQRVVWRISVFERKSGKPLMAKDVHYLYVKIPGQPNQGPGKFGKHGRDINTAPWFWTLGWNIPADYPLGTVDFQIVVKTKRGSFGYFKQPAVAAAQLTVTP